jgi:hypothetical protein
MTRQKKLSPEEIERQLLADADTPDAWEPVADVGASQSPRPDWYGSKAIRARKPTKTEPVGTKK